MEKMLNEISEVVNKNMNDLLLNLKKQIEIQSVEGKPVENAPYGKAVGDALEGLLALGSDMGFSVKNHEGYVGTIEWGEGKEILGVLSHVDVVPPGDIAAWNTPPYEMTLKEGYLYGRGVADDKGPLLSALYGMYALKQIGFTPKKRIRFIIGTNEETGWGCINYYKAHCETPDLSFSPDGMFTVVNREKGIFSANFQKSMIHEIVTISGGEAGNLVPSKAEAILNCSVDAVKKAVDSCKAPKGAIFHYEACGAGTKLNCTGKSAHAMNPEKGISAVEGILCVISACEGISSDLKNTVAELLSLIGNSPDGKGIGIACSDEVSGILTVNLGMLSLKDNLLSLKFDIRTPVTADLDDIISKAENTLAQCGYKMSDRHIKYPLYVPTDSELVKTLCNVYTTVTEEEAVLCSIGGGTYARAFPNCVCFGAVYPKEVLTVHAPNERALEANVIKNAMMYGLAVYELSK